MNCHFHLFLCFPSIHTQLGAISGCFGLTYCTSLMTQRRFSASMRLRSQPQDSKSGVTHALGSTLATLSYNAVSSLTKSLFKSLLLESKALFLSSSRKCTKRGLFESNFRRVLTMPVQWIASRKSTTRSWCSSTIARAQIPLPTLLYSYQMYTYLVC